MGAKESVGKTNHVLQTIQRYKSSRGYKKILIQKKGTTMTKETFINNYTSGDYSRYNEQVVTFIANILYDKRNEQDTIRSFFRAGYCYYFANLLKTAFGRGIVCQAEPFGHMVWVDEDGCAYDIDGPYDPKEHECEQLTDASYLGDLLLDFLHIPGKEYHASKAFHGWAEFMHMSDTYACTLIYIDLPTEEREKIPRNSDIENKYPGIVSYDTTLDEIVYSYWIKNQTELQEKYWGLRESRK